MTDLARTNLELVAELNLLRDRFFGLLLCFVDFLYCGIEESKKGRQERRVFVFCCLFFVRLFCRILLFFLGIRDLVYSFCVVIRALLRLILNFLGLVVRFVFITLDFVFFGGRRYVGLLSFGVFVFPRSILHYSPFIKGDFP
jgi:hypothetical protein